MKHAAFYFELGQRIKAARYDRSVRQEDLAKKLGLSRTSLTNIEAGRQSMLLHQFLAVERALGVPHLSLLPPLPSRDVIHIRPSSVRRRRVAPSDGSKQPNVTGD